MLNLILADYGPILLQHLDILLRRLLSSSQEEKKNPATLQRSIKILTQLSHDANSPLLPTMKLLTPLLLKPNKLVVESTKVHILTLMRPFILVTAQQNPNLWDIDQMSVVVECFCVFESRVLRSMLVELLQFFMEVDSSFKRIAGYLRDLNAFSEGLSYCV